MNPKLFLWLLTAILLVSIPPVEAQQPGKIPRIGYISATGDVARPGPLIEAFRQGLQDLGYIEGKNILVDYRYIEGKVDQAPALVAELVEHKPDALIVMSLPSIRAAKPASSTIPIVMVTTLDPVATGIIDSLARPGGNITGVATLLRNLSGKRLELLKEAVPRTSRVGVLWDAAAPAPVIAFNEYEAAALSLKLQLQSLAVRGPNPDLAGAFRTAATAHSNALITIINPTLGRYKKEIVELALENRPPSMHESSQIVEVGGLMSYSADSTEMNHRAAVYVDKILKGSKPGDLPVEQPKKFELVINLKTAKQIGLNIPPNVLARADRVIR